MTMRILSPQLSISPTSNLGGAVYDRELLSGLADLGAVIHIPLPRLEAYTPRPNWQIYPAGRHTRYTYGYNLYFLPTMLRLWRRSAFDLLRIHTPSLALSGGLVSRLSNRPVVAHYHHLDPSQRGAHWLSRMFIRMYSLVTTDSQFSANQLRQAYGLPDLHIQVAYPGVADSYRPFPSDPTARRRWAAPGQITLLYLGVLAPRKNLSFLLNVFKLALAQEPRLVLIIAGAGPLDHALRQEAASLGLDEHVHFPGYIPEAGKPGLFNLADLFVFPSLLEGFGMAAAEAMACGVPVITANSSSLPEVVGAAGVLSDPSNPAVFASDLLALVGDAPRRKALGAAGLERVRERFSWMATAQLTLQAYQGVLQRWAEAHP